MTSANQFKVRSIAFAAALLLACATAEAQVGPGTPGKIAKFNSPNTVGDSVIFEEKFGKVGVGTNLPTSKLTVAGMIESQSGGFKFPDGTIQTSAMKDPALSAFQKALHIQLESGQFEGEETFEVPANKRLVIEHLTLRATSTGIFRNLNLNTSVNGVVVSHHIQPTHIAFIPGSVVDLYAFQNQVRIYADSGPGSMGQVVLQAIQSSAGTTGHVDLTISGYLVDLPAAARETSGANKLASIKTAKRKF